MHQKEKSRSAYEYPQRGFHHSFAIGYERLETILSIYHGFHIYLDQYYSTNA